MEMQTMQHRSRRDLEVSIKHCHAPKQNIPPAIQLMVTLILIAAHLSVHDQFLK